MNLVPYIKAGYPVLYLVTAEESRAEIAILKSAQEAKRNLKVWSHTEGFNNPDGSDPMQIEDPVEALITAKKEPPGTIMVMRDLHMFLTIPKTFRLVRDMARAGARVGEIVCNKLRPLNRSPRSRRKLCCAPFRKSTMHKPSTKVSWMP